MIFKRQIINLVEHKIQKLIKEGGCDITRTRIWAKAKRMQNRPTLSYICMGLSMYYLKHNRKFLHTRISDVIVLNNTVYICVDKPCMIYDNMCDILGEVNMGRRLPDFGIVAFRDTRNGGAYISEMVERYRL